MTGRKKHIIQGCVGAILLIVFLFFGSGMHLSGDVQDCEMLKPLPAETFAHMKKLDFSEKARISSNKFGFRKEIKVNEDSVLIQEVGGPPNSNAYFGVFKDEKLTQPVEVADFKWLYRDDDFEEGLVDEVPYDENKDGIIILKPGTYYVAVYTKGVFDTFEADYLSYIHPLNENCQLSEGEKETFYVVKEKQKNAFSFTADKDGQVKISTNIYNANSVNVCDQQGSLLKPVMAKKNDKNPVNIVFPVKKNHTYTVEVSNLEFSRDAFLMHLYEVTYEYI